MRQLFSLGCASLGCALLLSACSTAGPGAGRDPAPPPPRVDHTAAQQGCNAGSVQDRVGRTLNERLQDAIVSESGAQRIRVLRPGDMATMDHRPERINLHLDEKGVISRITCG
ncbi:I78 family peptidase inhibitor [Litchfieldella xinjiangensis]|uniref:I78 family peptidase inhibitor n=1 Tax=Litchfieldella xinjiangensis TaxID=1166948 RepID=UPI0009E086A7|nr:I78 family peptidase inhibitor [Halomonas xinjiangensis]